jgi:hypothetical protein
VGFGLILYGFCTVLYTAWDLDVTHDEGHYVALGLDYLRGDMTKQNMDTGPFSRWFGATVPYFSGLAWAESEVADKAKPLLIAQTLLAYRIPHVLLYLIGALWLYRVILAKAGSWSGLIFAIYVGLDPTLKAFSALNVTDANVAWLLALAAIHLYLYARPFQSTSSGELVQKTIFYALACFFFGLAVTAKVTALLYGLFLALVLIVDFAGLLNEKRIESSRNEVVFKHRLKQLFAFVLVGTMFFFFAIWVGYRGDLRYGLDNLYQVVVWQMGNNESGHTTALFQDVRSHGYWYYFLVVFFFKTPLSIWFLLSSILGFVLYRHIRRLFSNEKSKHIHFDKVVFLVFILPFIWIFLFLSSGNIHIGIRYLLGGILLLWVGLALAKSSVGTMLNTSRWAKYGLCAVIVFGLFEDISTLRSGAYIAYFNPLTPSPVLNFTDSNSGWGQGLPKHLAAKYAGYRRFSGYVGDYLSEFNETSQIISSASELFGAAYSTNELLRTFESVKSVAGHRLFNLDNGDWYRLLANGRTPPRNIHDPETFSILNESLSITRQEADCKSKPITEVVNLGKLIDAQWKGGQSNLTFSDYVAEHPDLKTAFLYNSEGLDIWTWGKQHWEEYGYREPRPVIPLGSLMRTNTIVPGDNVDIQKLIGRGSRDGSESMWELYRILILGETTSRGILKEDIATSVKRLATSLGASETVILSHENTLIRSLEASADGKSMRRSILEFLRKVRISNVGYIEEIDPSLKLDLGKAESRLLTDLQTIHHYQLNVSLPVEGTYYLLAEVTKNESHALGIGHYPSLIAALIDGEIVLLGSHQIAVPLSRTGSASWGGRVASKGEVKIDIFRQFGRKYRNLLLLWQSCN